MIRKGDEDRAVIGFYQDLPTASSCPCQRQSQAGMLSYWNPGWTTYPAETVGHVRVQPGRRIKASIFPGSTWSDSPGDLDHGFGARDYMAILGRRRRELGWGGNLLLRGRESVPLAQMRCCCRRRSEYMKAAAAGQMRGPSH